MAHHKRSKPKSGRAGCLLCKPHKRQGAEKSTRQRYSQTKLAVIAREKIQDTV